VFFAPGTRVTECRDPKYDLHLELALQSGAQVIVSSDQDGLPPYGIRTVP
jgi:predicted nucleic acid-binding protein